LVDAGIAIFVLILRIGFQQITKLLVNQNNMVVLMYSKSNVLSVYILYILPASMHHFCHLVKKC